MLKLYRRGDDAFFYRGTWDTDDGTHTMHWGVVGERGEMRTVAASDEATVQAEIDRHVEDGCAPLDDALATLVVEYAVAGFGRSDDVDKRHRLEDRMNETLGWTGLGHCDGGSIGSSAMEVFCLAVDAEIARRVVEADLEGTEFADPARICDLHADGS